MAASASTASSAPRPRNCSPWPVPVGRSPAPPVTWPSSAACAPVTFARRQRGRPATAAQWDTRRLPAPHARVLFGGIETAEHFGPRIRRWAGRLGITDAAAVSVLADGAEWIWKQARGQLPGSRGLLDIYHAAEHLAD